MSAEMKAESSPKMEPKEEIVIPEEMFNRMVRCDLMDGETVEVRVTLLTLSKVFREMWQAGTFSEESKSLEFPMKNIKKETFELVVKWLEMQIHEEKQIDRDSIEIDENGDRKMIPLSEAQKKFFDDLAFAKHGDLLTAADFLAIPSLNIFGCIAMAERVKTMSEQEVRDNFDLDDDLTEEERENIRRQNVWCHY